MARLLPTQLVEKPWGRCELPVMFGNTGGRRIGEVWFGGGDDLPLLVKYIFTSEKLSIQVHPNDEQARERGLPGGKSECWYILDAQPDATLGLGLKASTSSEALRAAALDGSIEELMNWRPVRAGEFFMVPSGTVHAIGAGIALLEFQQNADVTYRLYDYGRPRELHLDDGMAVSRPELYPATLASQVDGRNAQVLVDGPKFSLVQLTAGSADRLDGRRRWVMPLDGEAQCEEVVAHAGECMLVEAGERLMIKGERVLVGAEGSLD
jgi:mannose-6-phosphate isomerase